MVGVDLFPGTLSPLQNNEVLVLRLVLLLCKFQSCKCFRNAQFFLLSVELTVQCLLPFAVCVCFVGRMRTGESVLWFLYEWRVGWWENVGKFLLQGMGGLHMSLRINFLPYTNPAFLSSRLHEKFVFLFGTWHKPCFLQPKNPIYLNFCPVENNTIYMRCECPFSQFIIVIVLCFMNCILVEYKSIHISQIVNQFFTLWKKDCQQDLVWYFGWNHPANI